MDACISVCTDEQSLGDKELRRSVNYDPSFDEINGSVPPTPRGCPWQQRSDHRRDGGKASKPRPAPASQASAGPRRQQTPAQPPPGGKHGWGGGGAEPSRRGRREGGSEAGGEEGFGGGRRRHKRRGARAVPCRAVPCRAVPCRAGGMAERYSKAETLALRRKHIG